MKHSAIAIPLWVIAALLAIIVLANVYSAVVSVRFADAVLLEEYGE